MRRVPRVCAREREALKRLPRRERVRVWWRTRPLGVTFTVYLAVPCGCDCRVARVIEVLSAWNNGYYELEVTLDNGLTSTRPNRFGPVSMTPNNGLLPASELDLPGDGPYGFHRDGDGHWKRLCPGWRTHYQLVVCNRGPGPQRPGPAIRLGLNYNEGYPQEDILR